MTTPMPASPFLTDADHRFVLDEPAFMAAIEPSPVFLSDPSPEYLSASDIGQVLEVLAAH